MSPIFLVINQFCSSPMPALSPYEWPPVPVHHLRGNNGQQGEAHHPNHIQGVFLWEYSNSQYHCQKHEPGYHDRF